MRYPKKGEAVWLIGTMQGVNWRCPYSAHERTPAIVSAGEFDPNGRIRVSIPLIWEGWADKYQLIYPDTNLCADGHPHWTAEVPNG